MIFRPVRPLSPWGPPTSNRPVGLTKYRVFLSSRFFGRTRFTTFSITSSLIVFCETSGACWVETTMVSIRIDTIVVSTQHAPDVSQKTIKEEVIENVVKRVLPKNLLDKKTRYFVNPTGRFEVGGPHGDSGLTGRKIIVDTYGGRAPHGGGAFSGKDPTKVDRSAAYAARHLAKNIVAAGLASECQIQVAYAIGVAEPVSIHIQTFGTGRIPDQKISAIVMKEIDMTPRGIIKRLNLRRPIHRKTAAYGHFGRDDKDFTWEKLDLVGMLKKAVR